MGEKEPEIDAYVRYRLERGDSHPIRKRIKDQEKQTQVANYMENKRLLAEFQRAQRRAEQQQTEPQPQPEPQPEPELTREETVFMQALDQDGFHDADERDDAEHPANGSEAPTSSEDPADPPEPPEPQPQPSREPWRIAPSGTGYASDPPEGFDA